MANDILRSPLSLDTEGAVYISGIRVQAISVKWVGVVGNLITSGDVCTITDAAGRVVFQSVAQSDNWSDVAFPQQDWNGLTVSDLDGGVIFIEV